MRTDETPRPPDTGHDTGPDPLADDGETMRDIRTCEALHEARAAFQDALVKESVVRDRHFAAQLRQEPVHQMAEFFFLLRAFQLDDGEKVRRYAELHNEHLLGLQADPIKMRRLGLSPTRVRRGMFSPDSIPKLVENYRAGDGAIDQSDLARLLIEVMSPETCRKTAVTLTEAGYLERRRSPYQSVLVRSTGALERIFAHSLRHVRSTLASLAGTLEPDDDDRDDAAGPIADVSLDGPPKAADADAVTHATTIHRTDTGS